MANRKYLTGRQVAALNPRRTHQSHAALTKVSAVGSDDSGIAEAVFFGPIGRYIFDYLLMEALRWTPGLKVLIIRLDKSLMLWGKFASCLDLSGLHTVVAVVRPEELESWKPYEERLVSMGIMSLAFTSDRHAMAREYAARAAGVPGRPRVAGQTRSS